MSSEGLEATEADMEEVFGNGEEQAGDDLYAS